ncbi:hypothetical protein Sango_2828100 [Sesamum angolense]|uniref:Reverse transcriptase zinc-binding domain-containing protein n=1 Tax=Sesamum angolense TaxID=2727404 RepID=A0AAE1VZP1_9LAMI|nr:hypothetical protein Sango_2828100 [Sesamum angolense]
MGLVRGISRQNRPRRLFDNPHLGGSYWRMSGTVPCGQQFRFSCGGVFKIEFQWMRGCNKRDSTFLLSVRARNAAKYRGVSFSTDGIILEVQLHFSTLYAARILTSTQWRDDLYRAGTALHLGIQAWRGGGIIRDLDGMYTLHMRLHWHRDQCSSRAHCRLAGFGACPHTRSSPLGGGGGCHNGDYTLTVPCFWEVGEFTLLIGGGELRQTKDLGFLTVVGKGVLIKSVLQSLPTYAVSCFTLPDHLLKELEKVMRDFWWHDKAKQGWCLLTCPNSLLSQVLKMRYLLIPLLGCIDWFSSIAYAEEHSPSKRSFDGRKRHHHSVFLLWQRGVKDFYKTSIAKRNTRVETHCSLCDADREILHHILLE